MAARKKTTKRSTKATKSPVDRIEERLPATLREYAQRVRRELSRIERDVERATAAARKQAIKLLRLASHELGRLEERGEKEWLRISTPYRRRAANLLSQLQKAVAPPADARRRPTRKAAKKTTARKKAPAATAAKRKVAKRKTTKRSVAKKGAARPPGKTTRKPAARKTTPRRKSGR